MPLSTATIQFDIADQVGTDYDIRRGIRSWVSTNIPGDTVIDTDGNKIRLGTGKVVVNADGTGTASVWAPGTGSNPASWQTYLHFEYIPSGFPSKRNAHDLRTTRTFGPFTITGNADLADLIEEQEVPPDYLTVVTAQLDGYVAEAEVAATTAAASATSAAASASAAATITGIDSTDSAVAALVETPAGPLTQAALSATIAAATAPLAADPIRVMETRGTVERETSLARARVEYEDNAAWTETWANLTSWETLTGLTVSGGIVYRNTASGDVGAAQRTLTGMATGRARLVATIKVVAGGPNDNMTLFGVTKNTSTSVTSLVDSGMFGIGVKENGVPWSWPANAALGPALATGTYSISVELSDQGITLILHSDDGTIYHRVTTDRASYGQTPRAFVWTTDSRGTGGNGIGPVGARIGYVSPKPALPTPRKRWVHHIVPPSLTQFAIIGTPAGYDSRKPTPWVIYCHGYGDQGEEPLLSQDATLLPVLDGLLNAGYGVVSADFGGTSSWGNNGALNAVVEVYQHLRDSYNVGPIVLMGNSMGGLTSLNTLARRVVPGVVGWIGFEPVVSLRNMYDHPTVSEYQAAIKAAYGIASNGSDYAAKTDAHDPALYPASAFRGVPMLMFASPGDTAVTKAANADALDALVSPVQPDCTVVTVSGGHMDPSHFNVSQVVSFVNRVTKS